MSDSRPSAADEPINTSQNPGTATPVANVDEEVGRLTRRSLFTGGIAAGFGVAAYAWLQWFGIDKRVDSRLGWPLRRMLEFNAAVSEKLFGIQHLAPEFPREQAQEPRENGHVGLVGQVQIDAWRLRVTSGDAQRSFTLEQIRQLPKIEMVTELKCVEGWSQIVHWGGARLVDFLREYDLGLRDGSHWMETTVAQDLWPYLQLITPDDDYYVGFDMASAIHPQTLLCYEMNGQPLTQEHGAPLRLVTTVKYGIKSIKRIGQLKFFPDRPPDYWAQRGYDWFAGL